MSSSPGKSSPTAWNKVRALPGPRAIIPSDCQGPCGLTVTPETTRHLHLGPAPVHMELPPPTSTLDRWPLPPLCMDMPLVCSPQEVTPSQRHRRQSQAGQPFWPAPRTQLLCASSTNPQPRTSDTLTRPSRKEQSAALCVHTWRYLHQWQGKEPLTQDRQLRETRAVRRGPRHPGLRHPDCSLPAGAPHPAPPQPRQTLSRTESSEAGTRPLDYQH